MKGKPNPAHGDRIRGLASLKKGLSFIDMYGEEKAQEIRNKMSINLTGKKSCNKGKTLFEMFHGDIDKINNFRYCQKGNIPWNTNETKETHPSLLKSSIAKMGHEVSEETREKISKTVHTYIENNKEEVHRRSSLAAVKARITSTPNNSEILVDLLLQNNFPNKWTFVGDGKMWVTSCSKHMNPDFVHCKYKRVLEYCGFWTYTDEIIKNRESLYKNIGWECLSIRPIDLKEPNIKQTLNKIKDFSI